MIDLGRTAERVGDFTQLKDKVNDALAIHDVTKEVVCTGVQRRAGGEERVKLSFASEEMAKKARQHDQWLHEARFDRAHMLGEQWYPVKVDRVHRATLSPDGTATVSKAATEAAAEENGGQIERIRWLSKASDKMYGSVVMFLTHQHDAQASRVGLSSTRASARFAMDYREQDGRPALYYACLNVFTCLSAANERR